SRSERRPRRRQRLLVRLDFAIEAGLEHDGFVPRGPESGRPEHYNLTELPSISYAARTRRNVREADGTVVLSLAPILTGGSALTFEYAAKVKKPVIHIHKSATDYSNVAMAVYGVNHSRSRELYDLTVLEVRRVMYPDLPPRQPIVPGRLVGTR